MTELPLEAATQDVIARYNRGNQMLISAAQALRRLKERVDAGEAGEMDWNEYRSIHLEPHITRRWINAQLRLAPPGATADDIARNVSSYRSQTRESDRRYRQKLGNKRDGNRAIPASDKPDKVIGSAAPRHDGMPASDLDRASSDPLAALLAAWEAAPADVRKQFIALIHERHFEDFHAPCKNASEQKAKTGAPGRLPPRTPAATTGQNSGL